MGKRVFWVKVRKLVSFYVKELRQVLKTNDLTE